MGKIAFVFSGQGDQFPGMGKDLYEKYPVAQKIYDICDGVRPDTSSQCFHSTEDELKETKNTQPCLFAMELAAASVLIEKGISPDVVAGFSLGEVVAATVSGVFDNETGFRLVCKRGELMQNEAEKFDTSMAAVVKLTPEQVQEVCKKYSDVYPVNFNCPGQITVSGLSSQMTDFFADVKIAGGRAIPLKVKGAFHSPFMTDAAKAFKEELETADVKEQTIPLYEHDGAIASNLCEECGEDKATVSRALSYLEANEFIARQCGSSKPYKNAILLMPKGREAGKRIADMNSYILDVISGGFTKEEKSSLFNSLSILNDNLEINFNMGKYKEN